MYNNQLRKHIREVMAHHQSEHDELIWLITFERKNGEKTNSNHSFNRYICRIRYFFIYLYLQKKTRNTTRKQKLFPILTNSVHNPLSSHCCRHYTVDIDWKKWILFSIFYELSHKSKMFDNNWKYLDELTLIRRWFHLNLDTLCRKHRIV